MPVGMHATDDDASRRRSRARTALTVVGGATSQVPPQLVDSRPEQARATDDAELPQRHAAEPVDHIGRAGEHGLAAAFAEPAREARPGAPTRRRRRSGSSLPRGRPRGRRATRRGRASTAARHARGTRRATPQRRGRAVPGDRRLRPSGPGTRSRRARPARRRRAGSRLPRASPGDVPHVLEQADAADDRRRVDRPPVGFVVERDVAADDRDAERVAGRPPFPRLPLRGRTRSRRFSGLPKLRQSLRDGSPPEHATLRAASSTASCPPVRGHRRPMRLWPSSETARPR